MKALIRADASVEIGMGHRVRCQALSHAFESLEWHCQFVTLTQYADFADPQAILIDHNDDFLPLAEQANLVILDHYDYQADDIVRVFEHQPNLLVLDDMNDRGVFPARWLLNPLQQSYSPSIEQPLIGSQYALLRPDFLQYRQTHSVSEANRLLITLGGTDPLALTLPFINALHHAHFPMDSVQVLLGQNAKQSDQVIAYCDAHHIAWQQGVKDVTPLMSQAKMAISAAGGTLFELACMGVPTVFAQVADNQTRSLEQHVPLGWCHAVRFDGITEKGRDERIKQLVQSVLTCWQDDAWLASARQMASQLVDGQGARRVASQIHHDIIQDGLVQAK